MWTLGTDQQVFMLFFAIFWGIIANAWPRWRAFHWPLCGIREVLQRALLAVAILNVLPILFFGYILWALTGRGPKAADGTVVAVAKILIQGVIPAFGVFGIYRCWIGIVELRPRWFYKANPQDLPEAYRHVEPTYRHRALKCDTPLPTVELAEDAGWRTLGAAAIYILLAGIAPWLWSLWSWFGS